MNDANEQIRKLLQLKRMESPGKAYFEGFLDEFHRYQRAALIEHPTWRTRLTAWWEQVSTPKLAWSGGLAGACAVGVLLLGGGLMNGSSSFSGGGLKMAAASSIDALTTKASGYHFVSSGPSRDVTGTPEVDSATTSAFDQDFKSARYVTGEHQLGYDDTLSF
jgi:hypothetical protein